MAKWTGVITNAGNSLLNAWVGEKTLRFDCAKAGTGTVEIAALMAQTDLVSQKQDAAILNAESVDGGIRMKLRVTASQEGYLLNQFGVWASVDGNTALIAIYQHDSGVSVPGIDESPDFAFTFYALIMTSNTGTWTVNIDTSALVTLDDMNSAIAESAKKYLPLSGGKMAGNIDMQGKAISGLNEPTEGTQAAPKSYVDKRVPLDGSVPMGGNLAMGGNRITGLAEPDDDGDAATKGYADTKASLPKTDSGTVIALSDASDGPLQGLRIYGRTTQDGTPTPEAPVELVSVGDGGSVGVTVAGKNLLKNTAQTQTVNGVTFTVNDDGSIIANGTATSNVNFTIGTVYLQPGQYVLSGCPNGGYYNTYNVQYNYGSNDSGNGLVINVVRGAEKIANVRIQVFSGVTVDNLKFNPMIRPASIIDSTYTPYTAQTLPISTPNGLPGIPVTSGGNYTDADGQQWVCDEVDLARGVYVQRIKRIAINESSTINSTNRFSTGGLSVVQPFRVGGVVYGKIKKACPIKCDKLENVRVWNKAVEGCYAVEETIDFTIFNSRLGTSETTSEDDAVAALKLWLADNPIEFIAVMKNPIETPIPEGALAAYAALHTNRPNTTVYNDAGAYMDVGYYPPDATMRQEDIKEYVDAKHFLATVSLPAASWTGDAAPYTQTVPVSGILATDFPHVTPVYSSTLATALAQKEAWSMVNMGVPGAGEITFTCFEDKPTLEIPIQIEVTR